ncbi:response regulator [Paenibacillus rigui]|uniref:DNA-binding response regulator n=1 Tax=Paenibacillus rigui TaxID=554312 RepID=A0A229UV24_9BACL|nr:response regulator [Paenibacillus rigui]OXM87220.1 DNA-binding response regulator [Paenibacillus rigui]
MTKVMLVDDEILIRETIRDCIPWEKEGFIYCGDASDGEVALPMIEELQPDILITDIKMPFMDGLELSAIVRKRMPDVKIVILSGHGEFEYAQSALRIGVDEYCLKPVSSTDLISRLHKVREKIEKQQQEKEQLAKLKQREEEKATLSQSKLLNDLCSGFITTSEAIHWSASLNLNLIAKYYAVAITDLRSSAAPASAEGAGWPYTEHVLLRHRERRPSSSDPLLFKRSRTNTVWIFMGDSFEGLQQEVDAFSRLLTDRQGQPEEPGSEVTVGIGSIQDRLQGIHTSFLEAEEEMHLQRLLRQNRRALWETTQGTLDPSLFLDRIQFVEFLKVGSPGQAQSYVSSFAQALKPTDWHSNLIGYYILTDLTLEVFRSAKETYPNMMNAEHTLDRLREGIGAIRSWDEACSYLVRLAEEYWTWRSSASDKYSDMLDKVKQYIHKNYDKDTISLQDAAEHVHLSQGHLSKVFSQETGQTFIEYLTQTRIRRAMELLLTTQAKSYEIANLVGYNDAHYFSNLFKRVTGMTTKQFRKNGQISKTLPGQEMSGAHP